jgi:protein required for attachment to host cells
MKDESWVLVANSAQARLFKLEKMSKLSELYAFVHPESRFHEQDLIDTKPGRAFDSNTPNRHSMEPKITQKELEIEQFAKSIADYLEQARVKSHFNRLYIAAGPNFLGTLRKTLFPLTAQLIKKEISKDLVHAKPEHIVHEILE